MPLLKSATPAAVSTNIKEMVAAGHPQKQAVAAAMRMADEARKRKQRVVYKRRKTLPGALRMPA